MTVHPERDLIVKSRILIIDDDEVLRCGLTRILRSNGYECMSVSDVPEAREALGQASFALVLCDIQLPGGSGLELLRQIATELPDTATVMVTGLDDPDIARQALDMGAYGYVVKPFRPNELLINVMNALRRRELENRHRSHSQEVESKLTERNHALTQAVRRLKEMETEGQGPWREMLDRLGKALTLRDEETGRHIARVGHYCGLLAERYSDPRLTPWSIHRASMLHDAGKIGIPDAILLKRGPLTSDERRIVERHCELGYQLLTGSTSSLLELAASIALTHHERWDGAGYPQGLSGDTIPIEGRITAIADVFDALTSDRVYRPAFPIDGAVTMMKDGRGAQFDPKLLDLFLDSIDDFIDIRTQCPDPDVTDQPPIRVVIIDDHEMFVEGITTSLGTSDGILVVGKGGSIEDAIAVTQETTPDVLLIDWHLPDGTGDKAAIAIRENRPEIRVVILAGSADGAVVVSALEAGCSGVLSKEGGLDTIVDAIRMAYLGEVNLPLTKLSATVTRLRTPFPRGRELTRRELDVLRQLAEGLSNEAIAERLVISLNTVRNHVQRIITKLGAHSKLEAVTIALRSGIIDLPQLTG